MAFNNHISECMSKRVGLIGDNSVEFVIQLLDIWNQGRCAVIVDWRIPFETAMNMLIEAGAEECYIDDKIAKNENGVYRDIKINVFKSVRNIVHIPQEVQNSFISNYSQEEALVLFSSGTTGKSKGVILTHYAISTNADAIIKYMKLMENDCIYLVKTLAHSSTIIGELLVGLKSQIKLVIAPTITSASASLSKMIEFGATIVCMNPTLLKVYLMTQKIKKYDVGSLRVIYISGAPIEKEVIEEANIYFNGTSVLNVYGLSEAGPRVTAQTLGNKLNKLGGVGRAIDNVRIRIINDLGIDVGVNERGRILVASACMAKGYVTSSSRLNMVEDIWLDTRDVGYFDEDGELFITGRTDNMVNVGAHNVYPEEVEDYIRTAMGVQNCVVLSQKDNSYGERLFCYYMADTDLSEQLKGYCKKALASYEIPSAFIKVDTVITNFNGKKVRDISVYSGEQCYE